MLPAMRSAAMVLALLPPLVLSGCMGAANTKTAKRVKPAAQMDNAPADAMTAIDLSRYEGRWFVVVTTFQFWNKKNRSDPTFVYTRLPDPRVTKMWDATYFKQNGRNKRYLGVDIQDPTLAGHFLWQGVGWMGGIKNHWYALRVADDYSWALIYFPKSSLGTPEAVELISRTPTLPPDTVRDVLDWARERPRFRALMEQGLITPRHGDRNPPPYPLND